MSFLKRFLLPSRYKTRSFGSRCTEEDNFMSTTFKVTFFNILFTGYISNCLIQMHHNQKDFENKLNKKLDSEFSKLQSKK